MTITLAAWAKARGVSRQCAWRWAADGRIAGAVKVGARWRVPADAPRPGRGKRGPGPRVNKIVINIGAENY